MNLSNLSLYTYSGFPTVIAFDSANHSIKLAEYSSSYFLFVDVFAGNLLQEEVGSSQTKVSSFLLLFTFY